MGRERHFWMGVVSREHVQFGVEHGIAQLNHGKRAALARMHQGDWLVYYSPRTSYPEGEPLRAFTALGEITSPQPYQVEMGDGFHPFRHDVRYLPAHEAPISPLISVLECFPDKQHWGAQVRYGVLSLSEADFRRIAESMGVELPELVAGE